MLDAVTAGAKPTTLAGTSPAASEVLAVIDTSDTGADLAWKMVEGTAIYRISRADANGQFTVVGEIKGLSFADSPIVLLLARFADRESSGRSDLHGRYRHYPGDSSCLQRAR